jgi:hypothetical protein
MTEYAMQVLDTSWMPVEPELQLIEHEPGGDAGQAVTMQGGVSGHGCELVLHVEPTVPVCPQKQQSTGTAARPSTRFMHVVVVVDLAPRAETPQEAVVAGQGFVFGVI